MYVARDENNYLYLYTNKPKKSSDGYWYSEREMSWIYRI